MDSDTIIKIISAIVIGLGGVVLFAMIIVIGCLGYRKQKNKKLSEAELRNIQYRSGILGAIGMKKTPKSNHQLTESSHLRRNTIPLTSSSAGTIRLASNGVDKSNYINDNTGQNTKTQETKFIVLNDSDDFLKNGSINGGHMIFSSAAGHMLVNQSANSDIMANQNKPKYANEIQVNQPMSIALMQQQPDDGNHPIEFDNHNIFMSDTQNFNNDNFINDRKSEMNGFSAPNMIQDTNEHTWTTTMPDAPPVYKTVDKSRKAIDSSIDIPRDPEAEERARKIDEEFQKLRKLEKQQIENNREVTPPPSPAYERKGSTRLSKLKDKLKFLKKKEAQEPEVDHFGGDHYEEIGTGKVVRSPTLTKNGHILQVGGDEDKFDGLAEGALDF